MTIVLFIKSTQKHDHGTMGMLGTHVETRIRKDGVVQGYNVSSARNKASNPILDGLKSSVSHIRNKAALDFKTLQSAISDFGTGQDTDADLLIKKAVYLIAHMSSTGRLSGTHNLILRDKIRGQEVLKMVKFVADNISKTSDPLDAVRSYFRTHQDAG